ncbi:hypothetical protein HGP17_25560 [Rhizobium sp. P38BS-XIX]|uniref:hypothetical protein n=1 Tax=Rhizobium sp. P38BS-XIX TaxID=2726740 RepID=UPI0014567FEB|nr:hypothetical protein [Rhizobium sp. P38BS-XIX]NLS00207.1 hypothetical protein [Rhizobium sp. P38BS-XIX]
MRSSQMLSALRDAMRNHAVVVGPIPENATADICELLTEIAAECEQMERRLGGDVSADVPAEGGNIISFLSRTRALQDKPTGEQP